VRGIRSLTDLGHGGEWSWAALGGATFGVRQSATAHPSHVIGHKAGDQTAPPHSHPWAAVAKNLERGAAPNGRDGLFDRGPRQGEGFLEGGRQREWLADDGAGRPQQADLIYQPIKGFGLRAGLFDQGKTAHVALPRTGEDIDVIVTGHG
jgi:hypothetical protein